MRRPSYLVRGAGGIYYLRLRVPRAARELNPELPAELRRSTGTRNRREALRIVRHALAETAFAELRHRRTAGLEPSVACNPALDPPKPARFATALSKSAVQITHGQAKEGDMRLSGWVVVHNHATGQSEWRPEPGDSPEEQRRAMADFLAAVRAVEVASGRQVAGVPEAPPGLAGAQAVEIAQPVANEKGPWLSDAVYEWRDQQLADGVWLEGTWGSAYEPALRRFRELSAVTQRVVQDLSAPGMQRPIWDIRLAEISRETVKTFTERFRIFPRQQGRRRVLDSNQVLQQGGEAQTSANFFKNMNLIACFLGWAKQKGYVQQDIIDEFSLQRAGQKARQPTDGRRAFDRTQLAAIFDSPFYAGDGANYAYEYWGPMIALHTGERLSEVAGAHVDDFIIEDGVPCIRVVNRPVGKDGEPTQRKGKTPAAKRLVPIHPTLISLGLLRFVAARRAVGAAWLFDGLLYEKKSGRGRYLGEWFAEYAKQCGVHQPQVHTFHSFRSNFIQALEDVGLEEYLIDVIVGHKPKSTRGKHYRKRADGTIAVPVPRVMDKLEEVDFGVTFHRSRRWSGSP